MTDYQESRYRSFSYTSGVVFTCTLGSCVWGYSMGVFNTCHEQVLYQLPIQEKDRPFYQGLITSLIPLGAIFGAFLTGLLTTLLGRRRLLMVTDLLTILAVTLTLSLDLNIFLLGRFLQGICVGLQSTGNSIYIQEMVTRDTRGIFGSWHQILMSTGIVISYIAGTGIPNTHFSTHLTTKWWRVMFAIPIIFSALRLFIFLFVIRYDTPRMYMLRGRETEAMEVLSKIYDEKYVKEEFDSLAAEVAVMRRGGQSRGWGTLCGVYRRSIIIGLLIAIFNPLTGQQAMVFYSNDIFKGDPHHKISHSLRTMFTVIMGFMVMIPTIMSGCVIERFGRRWAYVVGNALLVVSHVMFLIGRYADLYNLTVVAVFGFQFVYGVTIGPLIWIYLPEILPPEGVSICSFSKWVFVNVTAWFFPIMLHHGLGLTGAFGAFALLTVVFQVIALLFVQETKGKTHADMNGDIHIPAKLDSQ